MSVDVAVRLGLQGGQAVTKGFDEVGRKGSSSLASMRKEAAALPPHLVAVSRGVGLVKDNLDDMAARAGGVGKVFEAFGPAGLYIAAAGAAGAAAAVGFYRFTEAAIAAGDAIADAATNAGVSTDTLQEMRYAVHAMGGEYEDADKAIGDFTKKLGAAESGNQKALKAFKQLGFSQDDLKSFKSADEGLRAVMERVSQLGKESERQYISEKLGLGPMIPLLREGTAKMDELREAAHNLGYVMDADLVAAAGEANDKLEDLKQITGVQLNSAMVEAAPLILAVAGGIADGAKEARGLFGEIRDGLPVFQKWLDKLSWLRDLNNAAKDFDPLTHAIRGIRRGVAAAGRAGRGGGDPLPADFGMNDGGALNDRQTGADVGPLGYSASLPNGSLGDYSADSAASAAAAKAKAAAAAAKREQERLAKFAEKAGKDIAAGWEAASKAAGDYADATALSAAKLSENASEVDQLERIKAYYADLNALTKAGVDLLEAKALVSARIVAEAQAEAKARSNPEDFVSSADRLAKLPGAEVLTPAGYDFTWLREGAGNAFYEGLMDAQEGGDFFQTFENRLRQAAMSALADKLTDALFSGGQDGGGGGGGWIDKAFSAVTSWLSTGQAGRATGGPVYRGDVRSMHEYGLEGLYRSSADGYVTDAARTAREIIDGGQAAPAQGGGSGGPISVQLINGTGTPLTATATERRDAQGNRTVDIDLQAEMYKVADSRVRQMFNGRGDDTAMNRAFGVRRPLNGG
jgi:hypothetical protein